MVDRGLHKEKFEPIVQPGEFVQTFPKKKFYRVLAVYGLPNLSVDFCDSAHLNASLTTTESAEKEISDVYLDDLELSQLRMVCREAFAVTWMGKPKARPYMTTKNKTWQFNAILDDARTNPAVEYLHLQEIFQFEDTEMWVKCKANTATLTAAHIEFFGYRFILEEVKEASIPKGIKPTVVPTEGWPGTAE